MGMLYFISVFVHIVCASFWIGGMLFLPLVILPGIRNHPDRFMLLYNTGIKFRFFGWFALLILIITGFLNAYLRGLPFTYEFFTETGYGKLLSYKLILFVVMLLISGVHDFFLGSKAVDEMKKASSTRLKLIARWSGRLNLLLALIIAFLGVVISRGGSL